VSYNNGRIKLPLQDEIRCIKNTTLQYYGKFSLRFLCCLICLPLILILSGLVFYKVSRSNSIGPILLIEGIFVISLFMSLTPMIQRLLFFLFPKIKGVWTYRLALLSSASLGSILWICIWVNSSHEWSSWPPAIVFLGAFLGSLAVTSYDYGLTEINGSPSKLAKEVIYQHHADILGESACDSLIKRIFDISFALVSIVAFSPFLILIILLIWWEDPGPIFFIKNSVGRNGINFRQFKFRTMVRNAEKNTGLILASKNDTRILKIGKFLRVSALDEFPQLLNILHGDMSFVGPRPQRTILVYDYLKVMPQYALRHAVRPGLAGLAQVMGHYHITALQKLRFDRLYVRNMGFWLDLKLVVSACLIVFWLRFKNNWDMGGDYSKTLRNYHRKILQLFKMPFSLKKLLFVKSLFL
jgi:lipopolysaccharide/colanic/teichoic acid biosynthesis glycosyltransferase